VLNARTGRLPQAEDQYRRAIRLKPDFLEPLNQLGGLLVVQGRAAEGAELFQRALALSPGNPDLEFRLGSALVMSGRSSEAVAPLRAAIQARPSWVDAINALAWLKATDPEPAVRDTAEALALATQAARLTERRDARVLDTLAAAEAAAGRFDQALHTSASAIDLAYEQHSSSIAEAIESRRTLYKAHTPYVETAAARANSTR
jgi:spermidine synthase